MAKSKTARRGGAKRTAKRASRKSAPAKRAARAAARKSAARKSAARKSAARKSTARAAKKAVKGGGRRPAAASRTAKKAAKKAPSRARKSHDQVYGGQSRRAPTLDRERRTVAEAELVPSPPSSLDMNRRASAARTGRAELNERLHQHTSTSPAMTGGDVDADWMSAEAVGDEAPGGDNPTPDQDIVDEIGKAVGIEYDDDEELQGGDEIVQRDRNRWELDPASREDFEDE